jgi:hypothetical protein
VRTPARAAGLLCAALVSAGLLVACAAAPTGTGAGGTGDGIGSQVSSSPRGPTLLIVVASAGDGAPSRTWTLGCDPVSGSHPAGAAACAGLAAVAVTGEDPFAPVPPGRACPEVYGGPQHATVTGTWRGTPVSTTFVRTDGCQSGRWDRVAALLVVGPATPAGVPLPTTSAGAGGHGPDDAVTAPNAPNPPTTPTTP